MLVHVVLQGLYLSALRGQAPTISGFSEAEMTRLTGW